MSKNQLKKNEEGVVAIVVTVIVLLVISLTALGLARLARREQRQALDRQLSSEAFYLAEAGVNDAIKAINTPGSPYATGNKDSCTGTDTLVPGGNKLGLLTTTVDPLKTRVKDGLLDPLGIAGSDGQYSCVLIKHDLETIEYTSINTSKSSYADVNSVDNSGNPIVLNSLTFGWEAEDSASVNNFRTSAITDFPANWSDTTGILRVDITDLNGTKNTMTDIVYSTNTFYLYPKEESGTPIVQAFGAGPFGVLPAGKGVIVNGRCDDTDTTPPRLRKCNVTISGLTGGSHYFVRLKAIYNPVRVTFKSGIPAAKLRGVQAQIDSTGKVADVLKRIQVRVPLHDYSYPEYAAESAGGVCKRTSVWPDGAAPDYTDVPAGSTTETDRAICDLSQL